MRRFIELTLYAINILYRKVVYLVLRTDEKHADYLDASLMFETRYRFKPDGRWFKLHFTVAKFSIQKFEMVHAEKGEDNSIIILTETPSKFRYTAKPGLTQVIEYVRSGSFKFKYPKNIRMENRKGKTTIAANIFGGGSVEFLCQEGMFCFDYSFAIIKDYNSFVKKADGTKKLLSEYLKELAEESEGYKPFSNLTSLAWNAADQHAREMKVKRDNGKMELLTFYSTYIALLSRYFTNDSTSDIESKLASNIICFEEASRKINVEYEASFIEYLDMRGRCFSKDIFALLAITPSEGDYLPEFATAFDEETFTFDIYRPERDVELLTCFEHHNIILKMFAELNDGFVEAATKDGYKITMQEIAKDKPPKFFIDSVFKKLPPYPFHRRQY